MKARRYANHANSLFVLPPSASNLFVLFVDDQVNVSEVSLDLVRKQQAGRASTNANHSEFLLRMDWSICSSLQVGHALRRDNEVGHVDHKLCWRDLVTATPSNGSRSHLMKIQCYLETVQACQSSDSVNQMTEETLVWRPGHDLSSRGISWRGRIWGQT